MNLTKNKTENYGTTFNFNKGFDLKQERFNTTDISVEFQFEPPINSDNPYSFVLDGGYVVNATLDAENYIILTITLDAYQVQSVTSETVSHFFSNYKILGITVEKNMNFNYNVNINEFRIDFNKK